MDYEDLIALIDRLDQSTLSYLDYHTDSHQVTLAKEMPQLNNQLESVTSVLNTESKKIMERPEQQAANPSNPLDTEATEDSEEVGEIVQSPMIGVAYLQANPDEEVYVNVGDRVEQGDTVCIIEAMKIMNEIQAPVSGVVTEIFVENEEVVEFNQPLVRIKTE